LEKLDKEAGWKSSLGRYKSSCSITEGVEVGGVRLGKGEGVKDGDEEDDDLNESEDVYNYDYDDSDDDDDKQSSHQQSKEEEAKSVASHDTPPHSVRFSFSEEKSDHSTLRRNRNNTMPNPKYSSYPSRHHNSVDTPNRHHSSIDTPNRHHNSIDTPYNPNYSYSSNINTNLPFNPSNPDNPNTSNSPDHPGSPSQSPNYPKQKKYVPYKSHQNVHALRDPDTIDAAIRRARTYSTDVLTYFGRGSSSRNLDEKKEGEILMDNFDVGPETSNSDSDSNIDSNPNPDAYPNPNPNLNSNDNMLPPSESVANPTLNSSTSQSINNNQL
jgi:hypothetical protein